MSDPDTNPLHDLAQDPQDEPQPRARIGTVLALLRVLAGRRGHASLVWHRYGFTHAITVVREDGAPGIDFDPDPSALGLDEARQRLRDHFGEP